MRKLAVASVMTFALFAGTTMAAEQTAISRIPISDFASLPVLKKPLLSPDGRSIVARQEQNGRVTLVVLDADRPEAPPKRIELGKADLAALTWAGNSRLLLTVVGQERFYHAGVSLPFLRLIAVDLPSGYSRIVDNKSAGRYAGDVLYTDPTGAWALVAGQDSGGSYPSVKRVDLNTGLATTVEKPRDEVWDWYADENGVVRAGVAYDARKWTIWYRDKAGEELRPIRGKFEKEDESVIDRFVFRGEESWVITNERTGRFGLYKFDLKDGTVGAPIFEHAEVDIDEPIFDWITGKVSAVQYEDDRTRVAWLDPELKALQAKLDQALPNVVNLTVDWSRDEKRVLIWSSGASDPGRYYLLDRGTSKMHAVVAPYPKINPDLLAEVKPIRYVARDGLQLRGYLTLPRGKEAKDLPLIVMPHGGPFTRDHWDYDPLVQFLANRGYAVLQPQFRGSTGYGKDFVAKGHGEWGRRMQDDLDDGVDWLARSGQINPKRVCMFGISYGGYAAMWSAIRNPERYRCAASMSGVADVEAMLRYDRKLFAAPRYYRDWHSKVAGAGKTDLRAISPIRFANRVRIPVLIGHGEEDDNVPASQSRAMVDALTSSGADVTSVFYKEGGHGFTSAADLEDWLKRLEAFLAKHNPA